MDLPKRVAVLLPLLLLSSAACSSAQDEETAGSSAAITSGKCSASRDEILSGTSAARAHAIERGFGWLDANVPYSQSASHGGYRTDCSGFVSMCWELGTSTTTSALVSSTTHASKLASWDDLLPADALLRNGHVMLFVGWEPGKSGVCVLEQASTASDMQFRVRSVASLKSQGFKPIRAKKLAGDTGEGSGTTGGTTTGDDPEPTNDAPAPAPSSPSPVPSGDQTPPDPAPSDPTTCVSRSAAEVCGEAAMFDGVQCGTVMDECGKTVSCDGVAGFGCLAGETCSAMQQCVSTATPPSSTPPPSTTAPIKPPGGDTLPLPGDPGEAPSDGSVADESETNDVPKASTKSGKTSAGMASSGCSVSSTARGGDTTYLLAVAAAALGILRRRKRAS